MILVEESKCGSCGKEMEYSERCNLWYCKDCTIKRWNNMDYKDER